MSRESTSAATTFRAMGVEVVVGGADAAELEAIERLFCEWDGTFSRFRADSELSRVNAGDGELAVVSTLFSRVLQTALRAAAATGGLTDPTLGRAIEAAGYDRDFADLDAETGPLGPTERGGWREVTVAGPLVFRPPGLRLDLNGVVKALAVDETLGLIAGLGFVSAGGDVAARGGVVVGLPGDVSIRVEAAGVATSGTTHRRWLRGGGPQHHLIDPATGRPSTSRWDEVTVVAASCVAADVAAKAAFLLSEDGPDWLDERGLAGRFVDADEAVTNDAWRTATEDRCS